MPFKKGHNFYSGLKERDYSSFKGLIFLTVYKISFCSLNIHIHVHTLIDMQRISLGESPLINSDFPRSWDCRFLSFSFLFSFLPPLPPFLINFVFVSLIILLMFISYNSLKCPWVKMPCVFEHKCPWLLVDPKFGYPDCCWADCIKTNRATFKNTESHSIPKDSF